MVCIVSLLFGRHCMLDRIWWAWKSPGSVCWSCCRGREVRKGGMSEDHPNGLTVVFRCLFRGWVESQLGPAAFWRRGPRTEYPGVMARRRLGDCVGLSNPFYSDFWSVLMTSHIIRTLFTSHTSKCCLFACQNLGVIRSLFASAITPSLQLCRVLTRSSTFLSPMFWTDIVHHFWKFVGPHTHRWVHPVNHVFCQA